MNANKWGLVAAILALLGLGFAAMSTNLLVPTWIPIVFFVSAGLCLLWLIILITQEKQLFRVGKSLAQRGEKVSDENTRPIHVESHNQQGGITAYQVNIQPGDRQLSTGATQQLKSYLKGVNLKSVEVNAVMGDGEAFRFASQIKNFLTSEGFDVKGVNQVVYTAPIQGQIVEPPNAEGLVKIIIGNR